MPKCEFLHLAMQFLEAVHQTSLKQHNGDLKAGAKASRAGRPWICACLICGFADRSEACAFESKWKDLSRKSPRKSQGGSSSKQIEDPSRNNEFFTSSTGRREKGERRNEERIG
ncbi:structure-specific endonuclease subunit slx1 [Arachis ipaensis]|uniref:structure-specific endonuclease subunit slx1 n=1 Tax=Arachis ipaensis TaxID=130454 RepID=UPI0007AFCE42|nr:structure-specific endonuclease subunit slx1 [Arachis ipaensis]QHN82523.1 Structure-specific endonuclease subunit [Arachis hypogaea]